MSCVGCCLALVVVFDAVSAFEESLSLSSPPNSAPVRIRMSSSSARSAAPPKIIRRRMTTARAAGESGPPARPPVSALGRPPAFSFSSRSLRSLRSATAVAAPPSSRSLRSRSRSPPRSLRSRARAPSAAGISGRDASV